MTFNKDNFYRFVHINTVINLDNVTSFNLYSNKLQINFSESKLVNSYDTEMDAKESYDHLCKHLGFKNDYSGISG